MPKIKDFMPALKAVAAVVSPDRGVLLSLVESLFTKPKKKVEVMLEGKKTYIGIAVTAMAFIAQFFGYEVGQEAQSSLNESITAIVGAVGLAIATYGRVKATKK